MARRGRFALCVFLGLVLGLSGYVGLIWSGLIRSPLAPIVRGDLEGARSARPGLRVLFVGNSFTSENGMPALVRDLAGGAGSSSIFSVSYTLGGWDLRRAAGDDELRALIRDVRWDVVVLQERSRLPSLGGSVLRHEVEPSVRALVRTIRGAGAQPMLFMTWAYDGGDPGRSPADTFAAMQERLKDGYTQLGKRLSARVAPVGTAWAAALKRRPGLELWAGDGRHPSRLGSYLAACVFYASLTGKDPRASRFLAGVDAVEATYLKGIAWSVSQRTRG